MDIDKIINDYKTLGNVWKVGELNNLTGQRVHSILKKNGIDTSNKNKWTNEQIDELKEIYSNDFKYGEKVLDLFCEKHNKLKSNVCRKAKLLNLGTKNGRKFTDELSSKISLISKERIKEKGHPKGMLGKTHNEENKKLMSEKSKKMWQDENSYVNSQEYRQLLSDRSSKMMVERLKTNKGNVYSKSKRGTIEIGGKKVFCRSSWEANICAYFQFLKDKGEIKDWELEPTTFWFHKIKRGVRSYKPDFLITNNDDTFYYEEVKGWMDDRSKTKIKRMAIYYPEIDLRILGEKRYKEIAKMSAIIPNWGLLDKI